MARVFALPRNELRTIGLIALGHGLSHWYMLLLPPLFPLIRGDIGGSWASLGLIITVYSVATAALQVPAGLMVDRIGARPVLLGGLALQAAAFVLMGLFSSYWSLVALMAVAGLGNSVFHPADYSILAAQVGSERQGRAFAVHTFAAYAGWVVAPGSMLLLASIWNWRIALGAGGLIGLIFVAFAIANRDALDDGGEAARHGGGHAGAPARRGSTLAVMARPSAILFFMFFLFLAVGAAGIQTFGVVALVGLHGATLTEANAALTGYFAAAAIGVLIGGVLADRVQSHERLAAICFVVSGVSLAIVGLRGLPFELIGVPLVVSALTVAIVSPSRDLLVRKSCPPGSVGTIFGFVTTGFSIGLAVGPPIFGALVDAGRPGLVFWLSGLVTLLCIVSIYGAKSAAQRG